MRYSTFRRKIIIEVKDIGVCFEFLLDNSCRPRILGINKYHVIFSAFMTPEEQFFLKLRVNIVQTRDYHIHETDRLAR